MTEASTRARPTLYKGIRMRSRLEADYARYLDAGPGEWKYEPVCFAGPAGQWLPDFWFSCEKIPSAYVEVKPLAWLSPLAGETERDHQLRIDELLLRMTMAWHSEPDATLFLHFHEYGASRPTSALVAHGRKDPWFLAHGGVMSIWLSAWRQCIFCRRRAADCTLLRLNCSFTEICADCAKQAAAKAPS